jgi:bifunctional DNase/RNase
LYNSFLKGGQNLIEVILSKIMIDETRDEQVIVMKEKLGDRSFPIVISIFEATAISLKVKGIETPRPMTHDLLKNTIENLGAAVEKISITNLTDNTFYARLFLKTKNNTVEVDSRPSDAIALALRTKSPIFVAEEILTQLAGMK